MEVCLRWGSLRALLLSYLAVSIVSGIPRIVTDEQEIHAHIGDTVVFPCSVEDTDTDGYSVHWWYLDHNLQISKNDDIIGQDHRFAIIQPQGGSGFMMNLQLSPVAATDRGFYQCKVSASDQVLIHTLIVTDAPVIPTEPSPAANFTDCCVSEGVALSCLPVCSPSTMDMSTFTTADCADDILSLIKCGSDGRNHVPCCRQNFVPTPCLQFCMNDLPDQLDASLNLCLFSAQPIIQCFQEGHHLLPTSPVQFKVESLSSSEIRASWQPPGENAVTVTGYRLFFKRVGNIHYTSTRVLVASTLEYTLQHLQANTLYALYVIAVNSHGSSQPSYRQQIQTHARNPLPPGVSQESFEQCCDHRGVSVACQPVLCGSGPIDSGISMIDCFHDVNKVFQCMSGERNHTACCQQQQIDSQCYDLCSGQVTSLQPHQIHCIQLLPVISTCFNDGIASLPGSPRDVAVVTVRMDSVVLTWSPPAERADLVSHYIARYWPLYSVTDSKLESVLANVRMLTVDGLEPGSAYTVELVAVGTSGSSIPSPSVIVITEDIPDEPVTILPTLAPEPYNETACCVKEGVSSVCLDLCDYGVDFTLVDSERATACVRDLPKIFVCGTAGRNHTNCCRERYVPSRCLDFCAFTEDMVQTGQFDQSVLVCEQYLNDITACMADGIRSLPSPPLAVRVAHSTHQTLTIKWRSPLVRPAGGTVSYEVSWRQPPSDLWSTDKATSHAYTIHNLDEDTVYEVQVVAVTSEGRSLPGPRMEARTPAVFVHLNVTVPADITTCCRSKGVGPSCIAACSGTAIIDHHTCSRDLLKVIECAADNRDHTPCCKRSNLPEQCLPHCRGNPKADSFLELLCMSFIPEILTCFRQGYLNLPSAPTDFYVTDITSTSVKLVWGPPDKNPGGVLYELYYSGAYDNSDPRVIDNVTSPYVLSDLEPIIWYTVYIIAYNRDGNSLPTSKVQFITIANESPVITVTQQPSQRFVKQGSVVILTCGASGQPVPAIKWIRHRRDMHNTTLVIGPLTPADTGRYTCVAENMRGPVTHNVFLNVQYPPDVSPADRVIAISAGQYRTAQLQCDVKGFPEDITWYKDGFKVSHSPDVASRYMWRREVLEETGLIKAHFDIMFVEAMDYGRYTCQVNNSFGQNHADILIVDPTVTISPGLTPAPSVINTTECCIHRGVRSKCLSICSFDIDLKMLLMMSPMDQSDCLADGDKILACTADSRNHTQCCADKSIPTTCLPFCLGIVEQPISANHSVCLLYMEEIVDCMEQGHVTIPTPPRNLRGRLTDGFIEVWWDEPRTNADKVQYYDLVYSMEGDQDNTNISVDQFTRDFNLTGVHSYAVYRVSVEARNHYGTSHVSNFISIQTYEMVPSMPYNVRGSYVGQGQIRLEWQMPQEFSGAVLSYNVHYAVKHVHPHYQNVNTYTTSIHYVLKGLEGNTTYTIYVTAVSSHFESKPSEIYIFTTGENEVSIPGGPHALKTSPVVPVVSVIIILGIVVGLGLFLYWYFRVRKVPHQRFKDTVSFENPGYASRTGGEPPEPRAWITDMSPETVVTPPGGLGSKQPITDAADGFHGVEVKGRSWGLATDSSVMKDVDSNSDQGYATLSSGHAGQPNGQTGGHDPHSYATLQLSDTDSRDNTSGVRLDFSAANSSI